MARRPLRLAVVIAVLAFAPACGVNTDSDPGTEAGTIDLTGVDVCSWLATADVQRLTGESTEFETQPSSDGCFWASTQPGVGAYVEITVSPRTVGLADYTFGDDCEVSTVDDVGSEAKGAICTGGPQDKIHLAAVDRGVMVTVLVNDPNRSLTPDDLVADLSDIYSQL